MKLPRKRAFVAIGANLPVGDQPPVDTVRAAVDKFTSENLNVIGISRSYATPAFPPGSGPDYVNAVVEVDVAAGEAAENVLSRLHAIEARFGRERFARWSGRTLDLDLVAMEDLVLPDEATFQMWCNLPPERQRVEVPGELILPHPRMQDRAFVLVPMADIAPDWRHPVLGLTVTEMLARLPKADRDAPKAL